MIPGSANPLLLASAAGAAGYEIERSVRFNAVDSASLSRTPASAGNRKTWTWTGWVKRSDVSTARNMLFSAGTNPAGADLFTIEFSSNQVRIADGGTTPFFTSTALYRDPSAWLHLLIAIDTTQATSTNRLKIYVNGTEVSGAFSYPAQNYDTQINNTSIHYIGRWSGGLYFSGYLADVHFIDGQALPPSSFGQFDSNGVWQPKAYSGSYGTNGFYLPFSDNSTAAALGTDGSGNGNTWTVNNISVAAGAGNDSLVDSPTNYGTDTGAGGEVRGNYATLNPLDNGGITLSNGNLDATTSTTAWKQVKSTAAIPATGKWYAEFTISALANNIHTIIGISPSSLAVSTYPGNGANSISYQTHGYLWVNGSSSNYGTLFALNDIMQIAVDRDAGKIWYGKNGTWLGSGDPANGSNPISSSVASSIDLFFAVGLYASGNSVVCNFGQRPFAYPAPSGFKALCTQNLPEPTIADGSTAMDVVLDTGANILTAAQGAIGGSADLLWIKDRASANNHQLIDTVRGGTATLQSNTTAAETTYSAPSGSSVAWTWNAGSSTVTNTDGTITSQVRANPSAGFSIVTYTGTGAAGTVGHGLGAAPQLYIIKKRSAVENWFAMTTAIDGSVDFGILNSTASFQNAAGALATPPTSSAFSLDFYSDTNGSGSTFVAYCFAPVEGYSAFGPYTGNGSADGPFVYTGFRPRWLLIKSTAGSLTTDYWFVWDTARATYNPMDAHLYPNSSLSEKAPGTANYDALSNGFKVRSTFVGLNTNAQTYIFAAFAESPFALARAR